ncbi:MAG: hypothetical protein ACHQ1G_04430 [Planctomycetota bacterium]
MRASVLVALLGLAPLAFPEGEAPPPSPYAAMGFPVTFNDEIITANDVARYLETKLEDIDPNTLLRNRDILIFRKINERIAADLSIVVGDREVDAEIKKQIDVHGGDAKFYEWLAQQGTTLERYKLEVRQRGIDMLLKYVYQTGYTYDRSQLLPWRVGPTPREVETAFRNDPAQRGGALRVRRLFFTVDVESKVRAVLSVKQLKGMSAADVAAAIEEAVRPRLEAALKALKERPVEDVAREHGARNVEAMMKEWVAVEGANFLATAEPGTWSTPMRLPSGAYEVVILLERDNPAERKTSDAAVSEEYAKRIRNLRATKFEAMLRLRALDESTVSPERVREDLRTQILESLREAEHALDALGIH